MTEQIPIQETIGGVAWREYTPEFIAEIHPLVARDRAGELYGGIVASGILRINRKNPPAEVLEIMAVLDGLKSRAKSQE